MTRYALLSLLLLGILAAACGPETTTATEPDFVPVSSEASTPADAELYASLSGLGPAPADRIALAIAIEGLDPAALPAPPDEPLDTYAVGDTRTFWTHNSSTFEFTRITAELMAVSERAYFWQDVDSQPLTDSGETATLADWQEAAESFDSSYGLVRTVFGREEFPGLDGDPRVHIIHSDSLGLVGGYFGQADQLPAAVESHSNEGQYFFISNTGSGGVASDYYKEVLAHEYQHMIHKKVDPNEEGWLNEGLSMLAQQVAGMRGDNSVADYLLKPDQSLWYWSSDGADYGHSFLYIEYLFEQIGQEFITALVTNPANGLASIDETLAEFDSPDNADDLYADALTAAFFNDASLASGEYAYEVPTLTPITPRYEFTSLPAIYEGRVQQYGGTDIVTFDGSGQSTLTFSGDQRVQLIPSDAHSGEHFWWSNRQDSSFSTLTREIDLSGVSTATLNYWAWYHIEEDWDYAYLLVSNDQGEHWTLVPATSSRESDPNDQNLGHGFTGRSGGGEDAIWIEETADLSAYTGGKILLRFAMQNDLAVNEFGFAVDDLSIPEIGWSDDAEAGDAGWESGGFVRIHNRVPQVWRVRVVFVSADGIAVQDLSIVNGAGRMVINFDEAEKVVVFVIGQTRYTTLPASYRIELAPDN